MITHSKSDENALSGLSNGIPSVHKINFPHSFFRMTTKLKFSEIFPKAHPTKRKHAWKKLNQISSITSAVTKKPKKSSLREFFDSKKIENLICYCSFFLQGVLKSRLTCLRTEVYEIFRNKLTSNWKVSFWIRKSALNNPLFTDFQVMYRTQSALKER